MVHQLDGVRAVPEAFGHLTALFVANDAGVVDVFERLLPPVFVARDDHARHPEEHDFRSGYEVGGRVVIAHLFLRLQAIKYLDGPQPAAEPRIHDVLILAQSIRREVSISGLGAGLFQRRFCRLRHHKIFFASAEEPRGDAVSPPQLPAHAPVLNVFHPMAVTVLELGRMELNGIVHHVVQGGLGQLFHGEEPLQ